MDFILIFCLVISLIGVEGSHKSKKCKPNIFIILADDMGFNDVSIHGSNQTVTPNIDSLGIFGIQLNGMYVNPICTPSRSSLLTGKYDSSIGMQMVIGGNQPYGLGLEEKTIAQYMKEGGYATHLVGKWHLGFFQKKYTPTFRGFDTYFGFLNGALDYYNHSFTQPDTVLNGFDMRDNLEVCWETQYEYVTDLLTRKAVEKIQQHDRNDPMFMILSHCAPHAGNPDDPLQAPRDEIQKFNYIQDLNRKTYAAMVSKLDESVGNVIQALKKNHMLENSIIIFMSDNGAPVEGIYANSGSNYPFRGQKKTTWQGGVRSAAAIWSPLLKCRERVSNQMIHISDWLPTLANIAKLDIDCDIDGIDVWDALSYDLPSPRKELLVAYNPLLPYMAYIYKNYKLVSLSANQGLYDGWLSGPINQLEQNVYFAKYYSDAILSCDAGRAFLKYSKAITKCKITDIRRKAQVTCNGCSPPDTNSSRACDLLKGPCLFDISKDPCETTNIASDYPEIMAKLQGKVDYYASRAPHTRFPPEDDTRCNPDNFDDVWTWWYDELKISN